MSLVLKKNIKGILLIGVCLAFSLIMSELCLKPFDLRYTLYDFSEIYGLELTDDKKFETIDSDSNMSIDITPIYVDSINIQLAEPAGKEWRLQLFYANESESFSEENSILCTVGGEQKNITLNVNENMAKARFDWGDESGQTFSLDSIEINKTQLSTRVLLCILLTVSIWGLIQLILWLKNSLNDETCNRVSIAKKTTIVIIGLTAAIILIVNLINGNNIITNLFEAMMNNEAAKTSMTFTSLNFLFIFFPLSIAGYYLIKNDIRNIFLVMISLIFYSVGEPIMVWLLLLSIVINYLFGLALGRKWNHIAIKYYFLILMLAWNFGLLFYYKYYAFTLENINSIFGTDILIPKIIQPLGISFFTFRTVSFCLDVYWGTVPTQKNFINVALYICFFPQVSMGPISKYNDFSAQLSERPFDTDLFLDGVRRIIIGLAKKLIIANNIGGTVDSIFAMSGNERSIVLSWLGIISYLIQLYYDFSGYSDIAIGVGQLFGFKTPENFNYPFMSKSVVEYWSRWHITLGTWLKNYLYTPIFRACQNKDIALGTCNVLALLGVWLFAGIWHGAGWNYVCYGLYYFAFIVLERIVEDYKKKKRKRLKLKKQPETVTQKIRAHIYFFVVLIFGQLLFRSADLGSFVDYSKSMFGLAGNVIFDSQTYFYWIQSVALLDRKSVV